MTSNPSIFEQAIVESHAYDEEIRAMALEGKEVITIYEAFSMGVDQLDGAGVHYWAAIAER